MTLCERAGDCSGRCCGGALPSGDLAGRRRGGQASCRGRPWRRGRLRQHYRDRAGLRVLRRGGTAADAAVAVASTLGVTDPFVAGIGGGGYFVYYDARTHRVYTIDGRETTPAADDQNLFIDPATGQPLPFPTAVTSGLSVGVPGTLMTWQRALDRWGRFSLAARPQARRARCARRGFKVDRHAVARRSARTRAGSRSSARPQALFLPGGRLPDGRLVLPNPDLAQTYQQIGRQGVGALYGGPIGADVVNDRPPPAARAGRDADAAPGPMALSRPRRLHGAVRRARPTSTTAATTSTRWRRRRAAASTVGESLNILEQLRPCRARRRAGAAPLSSSRPGWRSPTATATSATRDSSTCRRRSCCPVRSVGSGRA